MSLELEPMAAAGTLEAVATEEDRKGYECVDGTWVPKEPAEPPEEDDRDGCELVNGVWVEKPMSNAAGVVEINFGYAIQAHVRANQLGTVISQSGMYQMFADQPQLMRKPDLSFVRFGRFPADRVPDGRMQLAPDLAVEVISPNEHAEDAETKLDEYLRAGVRLVWVAYLPTRNVWAYRPDGTARLYRVGDTLTGEDVLPGFGVPVAELFEGV